MDTWPDARVRLTRKGNVFTSYWSPDGQNWYQIQQSLALPGYPETVYVGLCTVSVNVGTPTTAEYHDLQFTPDTAAPELTGATSDGSLQNIYLSFSELLNRSDAERIANYRVKDERGRELKVQSARLNQGTQVVLNTLPQREGATYTVTVNGVRDTASPPNRIGAGAQLSFLGGRIVPGIVKREFYLGLPGWLLPDLKTSAKYPLQPDFVDFATQLNGPGPTVGGTLRRTDHRIAGPSRFGQL